jgi:large subunit ribosomal protein L7Ae
MPAYVKFEVPKDVVDKAYEAVSLAKASGKIRKGINESTKAIERGVAKLVVIASDVQPEEIMMHLPMICDEKKVAYVFVPSKDELGKAAGMEVPTSSIAITEEGEGKSIVSDVAKKASGLRK